MVAASYPKHLKAKFPAKNPEKFTKIVDTVQAKLQAFDGNGSMTACELPDLWHLVHPEFKEDGPRYTEMWAFLKKWEAHYEEYRGRAKPQAAGADGPWDESKLARQNQLYEEYRERLIGSRSDDELQYPAPNSTLLAEAAAVYMVNNKHYRDMQQRDLSWKPSLAFAWNVAGDFFLTIKSRQIAAAKRGSRRGAAPVCDPQATSRLWAGDRGHRRRAPLSQTLDSQEY